MKIRLIFSLVAVFLSAIPSFSQQPSIQLKELTSDDLKEKKAGSQLKIVSASRSSRGVEELPVTVHVITGEEIRQNGYTTLVDVLKSAPGIRVSQPGSQFDGEMFLMRGLVGNNYTKILINNIPIQPFVSGTFAIAEQLPIAQAERIEVIYGPASAVYGADAMAGVINIITRTTDSQSFADANLLIGQNGYRHFNFIAGGKTGRDRNVVNYSLYGNFGKMDDNNIALSQEVIDQSRLQALKIAGFEPGIIQLMEQNDSIGLLYLSEGLPHYRGEYRTPVRNEMPQSSRLMGIKVNFRDFTASFEEMYRQNHSSTGFIPYLYSYSDPEIYTAETIQRYALSYQKRVGKINLTANSSYLRYRLDDRSSTGTNYNNGNLGRSYFFQASDDIFAEVLANYQLSEKSELTVGASYLYSGHLPETNDLSEPFNSADYLPFSQKHIILNEAVGDFGYYPGIFSNFGTFLQYFYEGKRFNWIGSLRFDSPSDYDQRIYNRIGGIYKIGKSSVVRASLGYAFKAPNPNRKFTATAFQDFNSDSIQYEQIPNPELDSEELYSLDLGFRKVFNPDHSLDVTLFFQTVQEQIVTTFVPLDTDAFPNATTATGTGVPFARTNLNDALSKGTMAGLQISLRNRNLWKPYQLHSELHLNFTSGEENLPITGNTLDRLRMQPLFMGHWKVSFSPRKKWYINVENIVMSDWYRRYIPTADFEANEVEVSGYHNMDITVRYSFNARFQVFTRITNLFNKEFGGIGASGQDVDLFVNPQRGRFVRIGLSYTTRPPRK